MTDFSQEYLPPNLNLVGENTPWGGNLTAWKPFSSQLSGELYQNLAKAPELGAFSVSAMGNRDREQYAMDKAQQWQSSLFPSEQTNWFDQHSQNMWNARSNMFQPMSGFMQNNPVFPNTPAPNATSMAIVPYTGGGFGGGQSLMPPSMFGGGGGSGMIGGGMDDVGRATDGLKRLADVLKNDIMPATEGATKQFQGMAKMLGGGVGSFGGGVTGPDITIGGGGGMGGFGGYLGAGGGDIGGGMGGGAPADGYGAGFPNIVGEYNQGMQIGMPGVFKIRQGYSMFVRPAMNQMNAYMNQSADQSQMLQQSGMIGYGDMMSGTYGTIQRQQAAGSEFQLAMGRNIYNSYGSVANAALGGDAGRGLGGALLGIGQVSAGAALVGAGIGQMFGPAGAGAGALLGGGAAAIVGAGGYAASAANDPYAIGEYQNSGDRTGDFQGMAGTVVQNLRYLAGTRSAQDQQRLQNVGQYARNVDLFAVGGMSTQDLKAWSAANGFNPGDAVGAGLEKFYNTNADKNGWKRDIQEPVLGLDLMLNPNRLPSQTLFSQQMALGGSYSPFMQSFLPGAAGAMGVGIGDQGGMNGLMTMYTSRMNEVQQAGGNVSLYQQQLQGQVNPIGRINQARYQAGYGSVLGLDNYAALNSNPYIQSDVEGIDATRYGYEASNPGFAQNVGNQLLNRASLYSRSGQPGVSARMQGMLPQLESIYNRGTAYGVDNSQAMLGYAQIAAFHPEQGAMINAIGSGDPLALSQNAGLLGDMHYQTMNTQTGMGIRYQNMPRSQYDLLKQDQPDLFRLSWDQAQGGEKDWAQQVQNMGRGLDLYQYQQATATRNIGYQTQTGGATGVNAQGYAVGGDGLAGLSQLFQAQGMTLQTGNGMGNWQLQDAGTALSRAQQMYNYNQQGTGNDLANRQWNESFALNQQQFNLSTSYQRQSMDISRGQQVQQEQWQGQDLSMNRNRMELSYGWQQEDFDRNIRFARGRDRVDLQRQQERAAISHSLDETQQGQQEDRFKTETQWNKDEFTRKKDYFEQSKTLAQQEMDMNKRHHDERQALTTQEYEKSKQFMTEQWKLEDQRRLLDRQTEQLQYKMTTDMAVAVEDIRKKTNDYNDALKASSIQTTEVNAAIVLATQNTSLWKQELDKFNGTHPTQSPGSNPAPRGGGPSPTPYAEGGFTGYGPPGQAVGVVHPEEYVVPKNGALVVRGDGGSSILVPYFIQMIEILKKGILNTTIYNKADSVKSGDVYKAAGTRFK